MCISKFFSPARGTTVALTWNRKARKKYGYHGNHSSKIQNILQNHHRSLVGKELVTPLCRPYPGSGSTTGQNIAPNLFLLSGASFWERSTTLHLEMPRQTPGIGTTLRRTAVSALWAPRVWCKTQRNKNAKETNRLKANKPLRNHPDLHKWDMVGGGVDYSVSRGLLALQNDLH